MIGGHRAGRRGRRGSGREAALAREVRGGAVVDRPGRGQGRVLADRVADDVVGPQAGVVQTRQAGELRGHERRLRDVGLAQALDRALEAELGEIEAGRLRCAVVDGPRGRKSLAHRTPHTHFLGTLSREAERHLALRHATSSQRPRDRLHRSPKRGSARPAVQASVNPNDSCRVQHRLAVAVHGPGAAARTSLRRRSTVSSKSSTSPGRTTRRKRTPSMPANSGTRPRKSGARARPRRRPGPAPRP